MKKLVTTLIIKLFILYASFAQTATWSLKAPLGNDINSKEDAGMVTLNNKLYILGGYGYISSNNFSEYDPATGQIRKLQSLGNTNYVRLSGGCLFAVKGKIYSFELHHGVSIYDVEDDLWTYSFVSLPSGLTPDAGFVINDTIFITSTQEKYFYSYNVVTNKFTRRADLPGDAKNRVGVAFALNGKGYWGGARNTNTNDCYDYTGCQNNRFYEYNPETNTWLQKASCPQTFTMGVGVGINGKGYVGMGDTKNWIYQGPTTSNLLFEYNPLTNTWAQKSNATTGVELGAVAVLNDEMYVFGGAVEDYSIDNMQKYDPKADKWHTLNFETGANRMDAAGFYADGKIYVGGGTDSEYLNDFYEYNLSTNQWTQKKNFGSYHAQRAAVEIDGKGYFVGGYYKNSTFNWNAQFLDSLLVYDPSSDTWEGKRAFPGGRRYNMMAVKHKGKLYAGMGIDLEGYFRTDFYEYDPNTNKWTVKASVPDLGVAKPRYHNAGYYVIGDTLYLYTDRYEFKYEFENNSWQVGELPNDIKSALYNKTFTTNNAFAYNGKGYLKHPSGKIDVLSEYDPTLGTWSPYKNNLPFKSMFSTIIPTPEGVFFGFGFDEEYIMTSNQWRKLSINAGVSTKIGEYNLEKNSGCGIDNFYGKIVATVSDEDGKLFASLTRNDFIGNLCIKTISKDTSLPYQESTGLYGKDYLEDVMVLHKGLVVSANFDKRVLLKMYYTTNELNNLVQKFNTKYGTSKTIDSLDILMYNALDAIDNNIKNNKYTTYKELGFSVSSYGSDKLVTIETSDNMKGEMYLVLKKPAVKTDVEENFVDVVQIKPYPNPTKETLYFSKHVQYQITDAYGKPIKQGEGTEANVSELAVGLYFISINGRSNKFIKE